MSLKYSFCQDLFECDLNYLTKKLEREISNNPNNEDYIVKYDIFKKFKKLYRVDPIHDFKSTKELIRDIKHYNFNMYDNNELIINKLRIMRLLTTILLKSKNELTPKN